MYGTMLQVSTWLYTCIHLSMSVRVKVRKFFHKPFSTHYTEGYTVFRKKKKKRKRILKEYYML